MSIKLRLAKWLAPEVFRERDVMSEAFRKWRDCAFNVAEEAVRFEITLRKIASQRTPKANATVNRMADMAEAELKGEG